MKLKSSKILKRFIFSSILSFVENKMPIINFVEVKEKNFNSYSVNVVTENFLTANDVSSLEIYLREIDSNKKETLIHINEKQQKQKIISFEVLADKFKPGCSYFWKFQQGNDSCKYNVKYRLIDGEIRTNDVVGLENTQHIFIGAVPFISGCIFFLFLYKIYKDTVNANYSRLNESIAQNIIQQAEES